MVGMLDIRPWSIGELLLCGQVVEYDSLTCYCYLCHELCNILQCSIVGNIAAGVSRWLLVERLPSMQNVMDSNPT